MLFRSFALTYNFLKQIPVATNDKPSNAKIIVIPSNVCGFFTSFPTSSAGLSVGSVGSVGLESSTYSSPLTGAVASLLVNLTSLLLSVITTVLPFAKILSVEFSLFSIINSVVASFSSLLFYLMQ